MLSDKSIAKKIEELEKYKDEVDTVEYKINALKEELKGYLEEAGVDTYEFEFEGSVHKISNKSSSRTTFNSKKFKEDHPDLYKEYTITNPTSRFSYK